MTATATPTPVVRLDHVDVPADAGFDARYPHGSDERYEWTLRSARNAAERRRAAKRRAEEEARRAARKAENDAANIAARARMGASLDGYVFGNEFR
ncbi:hypothetical protein [Gordonia aichiensis]|uniref:hypothetical protein n=1 Tax=Gordonia aichiensis TaxID=36820 RepID=UPI0032677314